MVNECFFSNIINGILIIIAIIFVILNLNLSKQLNSLDLIKVYDMKKNETITNIIQIRKNDGSSCNISSIFEDGKKEIKKKGEACI
jgi:hypothetical protein